MTQLGAALWSQDTLFGLLVYLIGLGISLVVAARLLAGRKSPAATLLWVIVIVGAPYLGVLLYYLLPHRINLTRLRQRTQRLAGFAPDPEPEPALPALSAEPLAAFLGRFHPGSVTCDNRVALLASGPDFFDALADAVASAKTFVHVEMYILRPDATGTRLLEILTEAAARGIEVRLLYDDIGSWALKRAHLTALVAAGGQAVSYAPLLWRRRPFTLNLRNHRKLVVVDGELAFLGGRNIADEYANDRFGDDGRWFDAMVEVQGPGAGRLHTAFVEDWCNAADEELKDARYFPTVEAAGSCWVGAVASGPDRERNVLRYVLFEMIGQATETIDISSPYLVPHPAIGTALAAASIRGVKIRLHSNGPMAEQFILYHAARAHYRWLLDLGVEVIETDRDYNHAKMFIVDGRRLLLGSANLDMRSFELNFELGALIIDPGVCQAATRLFEERAAVGVPITNDRLKIGSFGRIVDGACRLLSPIL